MQVINRKGNSQWDPHHLWIILLQASKPEWIAPPLLQNRERILVLSFSKSSNLWQVSLKPSRQGNILHWWNLKSLPLRRFLIETACLLLILSSLLKRRKSRVFLSNVLNSSKTLSRMRLLCKRRFGKAFRKKRDFSRRHYSMFSKKLSFNMLKTQSMRWSLLWSQIKSKIMHLLIRPEGFPIRVQDRCQLRYKNHPILLLICVQTIYSS